MSRKKNNQSTINDHESKWGKVNVKRITPKNDRQQQLKDSIFKNEITITTGISGSGKTFLTLYSALELLNQGRYKKILLVKSVTTLPDEELGFLKGDLTEKLEPFMMSYNGNLKKLIGDRQLEEMYKSGLIEVLPLAYIRGLSIDDSIVIVDETQNISGDIFKSIVTRIGDNSKYIFMGDIEQIDKKDKSTSCLQTVMGIFKDSEYIGTVEFTEDDCVRNPIIPKILEKLKQFGI